MSDPAALRERVSALDWYHTLELAPGVVTPGWFDLRGLPGKLPFPASLAGKRCLDIGTFDGFWAFEMEKRGASEVVAVDVLDPAKWDWPWGSDDAVRQAVGQRKARGQGFEIAREALGSRVQRLERSIYDLDPSQDGMFDFVYVGSLLLHLRDPVGALMRVRTVCASRLLLVDAIELRLTVAHPRQPSATLDGRGRPWWWKPNLAGLVRMVESAGFRTVAKPSRCLMAAGSGQEPTRLSVGVLRSKAGREALLRERVGEPHGVVLAEPR